MSLNPNTVTIFGVSSVCSTLVVKTAGYIKAQMCFLVSSFRNMSRAMKKALSFVSYVIGIKGEFVNV